jgi:lipopolysaccharide biosynthesis regulator YciM
MILALAALPLAACTATQSAGVMESGYGPGALAAAAIDREDWVRAEKLLGASSAAESDPARLINLGKVYMETGRPGMALSAWRLALASDRHFMVETIDGRWISTADLARQALDRHARNAVQSATR